MDIHQLRTFIAVAREGSITRASEQLALSQPAVSAHIKVLEDTLGLTLFERTPRGMTLTPEGQRLLAKAEQTLGAHQELVDEAKRIKGRLTGKVRLGQSSNSSAEALGRLITRLAERCPEVDLAVQHGTSIDVLNGLRNGTLDAGFYNEAAEPDTGLTTIEVARFGIYLAAPPGLVAPSRPLNWETLAALPWICPISTTCCGQAAESLFKVHRIRPRQIIHVDRETVTRTLIAGGVGVGLLHAASAEAARQNVDVDVLYETQSVVRVLFAYRTDRAGEPLVSAVSAMMQSGALA